MKIIDEVMKDNVKEKIIHSICPHAFGYKKTCMHDCEKCWSQEIRERVKDDKI